MVTPHSDRVKNSADISASTVYIVDDDSAIRDALSSLFRSVGLQIALFASASDLLQGKLWDTPGCLVLDIRMPGISGLDFQTHLAKNGIQMPIVFMTGHGDIPMSVRAMKAGAIDFLTKPFRDQDMLDAVFGALEKSFARWDYDNAGAQVAALFQTLTAREKEVMVFVTKGLMNKQIAAELHLSEVTVKIHRGNLMRKMAVRTLPDLVRHAQRLGLHGTSALLPEPHDRRA